MIVADPVDGTLLPTVWLGCGAASKLTHPVSVDIDLFGGVVTVTSAAAVQPWLALTPTALFDAHMLASARDPPIRTVLLRDAVWPRLRPTTVIVTAPVDGTLLLTV